MSRSNERIQPWRTRRRVRKAQHWRIRTTIPRILRVSFLRSLHRRRACFFRMPSCLKRNMSCNNRRFFRVFIILNQCASSRLVLEPRIDYTPRRSMCSNCTYLFSECVPWADANSSSVKRVFCYTLRFIELRQMENASRVRKLRNFLSTRVACLYSWVSRASLREQFRMRSNPLFHNTLLSTLRMSRQARFSCRTNWRHAFKRYLFLLM